jgi:Fe-S-cluster-containing dehydrogenase component
MNGAPPQVTRRELLGWLATLSALAGLCSCRRPEEKIVPYVRQPEEVVPGNPLHFATAATMLGNAFGIIVESHEGRPTKIEGNPRHPESLGGTSSFLQAGLWDLYDPDRSLGPSERGAARSWQQASAMLAAVGQKLGQDGGKSLAIVTRCHRSPTLTAALGDLKKKLPGARIVRYEPFDRGSALAGADIAFGEPFETVAEFDKASLVVAFDADPLGMEGSPLRAARAWADRRADPVGPASRWYVVESTLSVTGAAADHRFRCASAEIPDFLCALGAELAERHGLSLGDDLRSVVSEFGGRQRTGSSGHAIRAIADELGRHRGESLVLVGHGQPAAVHALVQVMNHALGNQGRTLRLLQGFALGPSGTRALGDVARALRAGEVRTVMLLDGNPVFDAPADLDFAGALRHAELVLHLATHRDETSAVSTWHLNRAHELESWSDTVGEDGTACIVQPLIAPLWGGRTEVEVARLLLGQPRSAHDCVRDTWSAVWGKKDFEPRWRRALADGVVAGSAFAPVTAAPDPTRVAEACRSLLRMPSSGYEVTFVPDSHAFDGRFANNAWLQELPDPITKLTWGNPARISAALGKQLGLEGGELVDLTVRGRTLRIPVVVVPGQADRTISVSVGQGRQGTIAGGVGTNTYPLRSSDRPYVDQVDSIAKASGSVRLARTQQHFSMEGRPIARSITVREVLGAGGPAKLPRRDGTAWGLVIDLGRCLGCGACVVACQAENNVPVVGVDGILRARPMHWLRIDRYFSGEGDGLSSIAQPVPCQHCENAPCETVCPVGATVHSPEGLNEMVYNRCVGSRYCANNCPFKVRRFNYFEYWTALGDTRKMQLNPEVTVRSRGVMEKCTLCVQRINRARIEAKKRGETRIADGAIMPACEQACPTRAIIFGDLADPNSRVSLAASAPRAYRLLEDLALEPRVHYLARIRNPNPELES